MLEEKAKLFKALGEETRLIIVSHLLNHEICACQFTKVTNKHQTTVSRHLKVLVEAGILKSRKRGRFVYYSIKDKKIKAMLVQCGIKDSKFPNCKC